MQENGKGKRIPTKIWNWKMIIISSHSVWPYHFSTRTCKQQIKTYNQYTKAKRNDRRNRKKINLPSSYLWLSVIQQQEQREYMGIHRYDPYHCCYHFNFPPNVKKNTEKSVLKIFFHILFRSLVFRLIAFRFYFERFWKQIAFDSFVLLRCREFLNFLFPIWSP